MDALHRLLHAARDILDLRQTDVAEATGVSIRTINRMERGIGLVGFKNLGEIRSFLETHGVKFLEPTEKSDWTLVLPLALAPAPTPTSPQDRVYYPLPGVVFRAARVALGLSQSELAVRAGLAHTTVRRIEKDDKKITPEMAYLLQKQLEKEGLKFLRPDDDMGWRLGIDAR